jgi:hypothetical protein
MNRKGENMEFKAIETVYNGYKFRSRLEARYGVFFDSANIPYEYEPEGFQLENGKKYLPDFYLPNDDLYVEIKGEEPDDDYYQTILFPFAENKRLLLLINPIGMDNSAQYLFCLDQDKELCAMSVRIMLGYDKRVHFAYKYKSDFYINRASKDISLDMIHVTDYYKIMQFEDATMNGIEAMKKARFEFQ